MNNVEKVTFTKHLAIMLKSGVPLAEAIDLLADQTTDASTKKMFKDIERDVVNGKQLNLALSKHKKEFDQLYLALVKTGENSGNLENNLEYLAVKLQKDYLFKQKVVGASMYPAIIVTTALLVGMQISIFVLPKLVELFESMDTELPLSTKILIWFATLMKNYGIAIFAGMGVAFVIFSIAINIPAIKYYWHKFLLRLPVIGPFLVNVQMTFITRNLGIMMKSGIPIVDSLRSIADACSNLVFRKYLMQLTIEVGRGSQMAAELAKKQYKHFPRIATKMIGVGEKTGNLDESLLYLADFFDNEVDNASKNLSTVLEPILLLGIGMFVGFLALAIISPIYQFTGSVHK